MKEENNTMEERFFNRYQKSEIYDQTYVDWFPDDVMQFIRMEIRLAEESLREKVLREVDKLRIENEYNMYNDAINDIIKIIKQ